MKIGVTVPNHFGLDDPHDVITIGCLAEELNFDSVWAMDHIFNTGFLEERLGNKPYYHPLTTLTYLAAKTERVGLGTSVFVLPNHDPFDVAKYVATLDHLSRGRLILGIGAGGSPDEFALLGIPISERGSRTNEAIEIMKALWTQPLPSYEGKRRSFSGGYFSPKPLQKPHPPIWVGGTSVGAKRRASLLGDGWHPSTMRPEEYKAAIAEIRAGAAEAGRDPSAITMSVRISVNVPGPGHGGEMRERPELKGSPEAMIDTLRSYEEVGADYAVLVFDTPDYRLQAEMMQMLATEVLPAFKV